MRDTTARARKSPKKAGKEDKKGKAAKADKGKPRQRTPSFEERTDSRASRLRVITQTKRGLGNEISGLLILVLGVVLFLSLTSFEPSDIDGVTDHNLIGPVGAHLADILLHLFGLGSFFFAGVVALIGVMMVLGRRIEMKPSELVGQLMLVLGGAVLFHMSLDGNNIMGHMPGGAVGAVVGETFRSLFNDVGTYLLCVASASLGLMLVTDASFASVLRGISRGARWCGRRFVGLWRAARNRTPREKAKRHEERDRGERDHGEKDQQDPRARGRLLSWFGRKKEAFAERASERKARRKKPRKSPSKHATVPNDGSRTARAELDRARLRRARKAARNDLPRKPHPNEPVPGKRRQHRAAPPKAPSKPPMAMAPPKVQARKRPEPDVESNAPTRPVDKSVVLDEEGGIAGLLAKLPSIARKKIEEANRQSPGPVEPEYEFESIVPPEAIADGRVLAGWKPTPLLEQQEMAERMRRMRQARRQDRSTPGSQPDLPGNDRHHELKTPMPRVRRKAAPQVARPAVADKQVLGQVAAVAGAGGAAGHREPDHTPVDRPGLRMKEIRRRVAERQVEVRPQEKRGSQTRPRKPAAIDLERMRPAAGQERPTPRDEERRVPRDEQRADAPVQAEPKPRYRPPTGTTPVGTRRRDRKALARGRARQEQSRRDEESMQDVGNDAQRMDPTPEPAYRQRPESRGPEQRGGEVPSRSEANVEAAERGARVGDRKEHPTREAAGENPTAGTTSEDNANARVTVERTPRAAENEDPEPEQPRAEAAAAAVKPAADEASADVEVDDEPDADAENEEAEMAADDGAAGTANAEAKSDKKTGERASDDAPEDEDNGARADDGNGPAIVLSEARQQPKSERELEAAGEKKRTGHPGFEKPPLSLLNYDPDSTVGYDTDELRRMADTLEQKLLDYRVKGKVVEICPGPVVTRFEFSPAPGTKVATIANLADDLKMALEAMSIRVIAPIPGKGVVGVEVPNEEREIVYAKEILGSDEFVNSRSLLTLALGKDPEGNPVVSDLSRMPHLLVAGATGSGKSVAVNTMIASMLYNATPDEVKLLMVDPKRLELSIYKGIPHLLLPPITDPKKAAVALRWACEEMEERYKRMAALGVRNIKGYNKRLAKLKRAMRQGGEEGRKARERLGVDEEGYTKHQHMPFIVIVIDELADLMMVAAKEVEQYIARLAQMARACGMHLILATQRPSVDVLTGLIKANLPTRLSFRVFSRHDSKTVLDTSGAEGLLGMGDSLFLPPGTGQLQRVHGAFLSDEEVERMVSYLKEQGTPEYNEEILETRGSSIPGVTTDDEYDEYYDEAVRLVVDYGQASISMLQRKLRVGYNRAARMVEVMEEEGLVGPPDGSRPREVLVDEVPEELAE